MTCSKAAPQTRSSTPSPSPYVGRTNDARVTKNETLVRRDKKWFRYDAPDKRLFKQLEDPDGVVGLASRFVRRERGSRSRIRTRLRPLALLMERSKQRKARD